MLAFGIEKMEGIAGLHGWAWIVCFLSPCFCCFSVFCVGLRIGVQFLLEGLFTILVAGIAYFTMHDVRSTSILAFLLSIVDVWDVHSSLQPPDSFHQKNMILS